MGVVPIINENDTVAVEEIKFGDNDHLSALTVELVKADLLVLLTDVAGVLDTTNGGKNARVIPLVTHETWHGIWRMVDGSTNAHGTGGMQSKLQAAHTAVTLGARAVITGGKTPRVLERILAGEPLGTFFVS
jgi:glutamate 5-kinase